MNAELDVGKNGVLFREFQSDDKQSYLDYLTIAGKSGTFADHLLIIGAANALKMQFVIHSSYTLIANSKPTVITPYSGVIKKSLFLLCIRNIHYMSLKYVDDNESTSLNQLCFEPHHNENNTIITDDVVIRSNKRKKFEPVDGPRKNKGMKMGDMVSALQNISNVSRISDDDKDEDFDDS